MTAQTDRVMTKAMTLYNYLDDHALDLPKWKASAIEQTLDSLFRIIDTKDRRGNS